MVGINNLTKEERELLDIKIKQTKDLLLTNRSFMETFTETLVKDRYNFSDKLDRSHDAINQEGLRVEIKGTTIKDLGDDYRTNRKQFNEEEALDFMYTDFIYETSSVSLMDYENVNNKRFLSTLNKIEFSKFDEFLAVLYFDDIIKIIGFSKKGLTESGKLSNQFGADNTINSIGIDRNNYKKLIEKNEYDSFSYEDIFKGWVKRKDEEKNN